MGQNLIYGRIGRLLVMFITAPMETSFWGNTRGMGVVFDL